MKVPVLTKDEWMMVGLAVAERAQVAMFAAKVAADKSITEEMTKESIAAVKELSEHAEAYKAIAVKLAVGIGVVNPHEM